jgi:transmembrane sensor
MNKADADTATDVHAQASAWLVRLRSGDASADEQQAFEQWCETNPQTAHLLRDTWSSLRSAAAEIAEEERANGSAWRGQAGRRASVHPLRPGRRAFVGFAIAAGASWLALKPPMQLWPALGDFAADWRTGTGEQRRVVLSERVAIEMNTQTRMDRLPVQDTLHGVELVAGEAEIVAAPPPAGYAGPMRTIAVVAGKGRMQAEVARFDIKRVDGQVCVTCLSGTVAFEHPRRRMVLQPAQQIVYDDRDVQMVSGVDPSAVTSWRRGVLVFNGVPLSQVVSEINRYRPGKIILRNASLGDNRIQAQFPIAKLDDVVGMLGKLYGAHITQLPGNIVLLS